MNCEGLPDEQSRNKNCSGLLLNNGMGFNRAPVNFLALLAVQNSSIGDLVTDSVTESLSQDFTT